MKIKMTLRTLLVLVVAGLGEGLPNLTEVTSVYDEARVTIISDAGDQDQEMVMVAGEHEVGDTEADNMERVRR